MKEFETIKTALNKATQRGVFDLMEANAIIQAITVVESKLKDEEKKE